MLIGFPAFTLDKTLRFESGNNNGTGVISFELHTDKSFLIKGAFFEQDEETGAPSKELGPPFEFKGTYTEDANTFYLELKTVGPGKPKKVTKSTLEELIKGSGDLSYIASTNKIKMNKNPKALRLYGILLDKKG